MRKTVVSWVFVLGLSMHSLCITFAMAKPDPLRVLLRSAFEHYSQGQYYEAIQFYQKVLSVDSTQSEAHYYIGDCFRYLFQYEKALQHYQQVQEEYRSAYPLLIMHRGMVHKALGNYEQATYDFNTFVKETSQKKLQDKQQWIDKAEGELHSLSVIKQSPFAPIHTIDISRLPAPVNSTSHDLAAVPYRGLDNGLVVTSTRSESKGKHYHDQHGESFSDNFLFVLDSNGWKESSGTHHFSVVNSSLDEGPGTFGADQHTYLFTRYTSKGEYHIFASVFSNDQWQSPQPLPSPINLSGFVSKHPALTSSGDTLFFSSDRPGGYGESDLWMSVRSEGQWQLPSNLGAGINTPYQETSPHWNAVHRMLFFASNGHPSWGGYDLFMTSISPTSLSKTVINLGKPLNSSKDDTYIWAGENTGYITSNRDSIAGNFDIFKYQYQSGPKLLLSLTTQSFWDTWTARLYAESTEEEQQEAHRFFSALPTEEKEALQRTLRQRIFKALSSENIILADVLNEYQQLTAVHGNRVQEVADSKLAFYLSFQLPSGDDATQRWFATLSPEEKQQMERVTQWLVLKMLLQQTDDSMTDERYTYEALSPEQRTWMDQATERGKRNFQQLANNFINTDQLLQWQALPAEEKERLQQALAHHYFTSVVLQDESSIDHARHLYEELPHEKQQQIDRIAHALIVQAKQGNALAFNESGFLPDSLSQEEQRTLYQLVVYRSAELRNKLEDDPEAGIRYWEELPQEEKKSIQRAVSTRHFATQAVADFSLADAPSRQQIDLHALVEAKPDLVTIRGKLSLENSLSHATTVALGDRYKRQSTETQADGSFTFEKVKYQQSQQLFIGQEGSSMAEMLSYSLEELEITVVQDSVFVETFDNLYFNTDAYALTDEARPVLERIADFHQRHPDIAIQIHAYADSVGSQAYNLQLSERRAETVHKSLVKRGVEKDKLVIVPKGKEQMETSKVLSHSRRVEFKIAGTNTRYNPTRKIYLLAASPDLEQIATRYGLHLDQLLLLNPGLPTPPPPYSIIKIMTNQQNDVE